MKDLSLAEAHRAFSDSATAGEMNESVGSLDRTSQLPHELHQPTVRTNIDSGQALGL